MSFAALLNMADPNLPWTQRSKVLGSIIQPQLNALVMGNQLFLRLHHVKPLYQTGVRYHEEPPTFVTFSDGRRERVEEFAAIPVVLARKWGDCDDLAPWRCAELRNAGEQASIRIQWKRQSNGRKLFHILVRRPRDIGDFDHRFMRRAPDGSVIEDPSRALGMKAPPLSLLDVSL
jgi:hypothetical protein